MFIIIKFQFLHLKMKNKTSCSLSGLRWRHEGSQQHEDNQFSKTWTFKTLSLRNFQFCLDFSCTNWFTEIVTCTKNFIDICTKFLLLIFLKPVCKGRVQKKKNIYGKFHNRGGGSARVIFHIQFFFIFFSPNGLKIIFRHWSFFHV